MDSSLEEKLQKGDQMHEKPIKNGRVKCQICLDRSMCDQVIYDYPKRYDKENNNVIQEDSNA